MRSAINFVMDTTALIEVQNRIPQTIEELKRIENSRLFHMNMDFFRFCLLYCNFTYLTTFVLICKKAHVKPTMEDRR